MTGWRRRLTTGLPAMLNIGMADQWFWVGRPAVSDTERLWWCHGTLVHPLPWPGVRQVRRKGRGIEAWLADGRHVEANAQGHSVVQRRARIAGPSTAWVSEGFLYTSSSGQVRAIDVVEPHEILEAGPDGAVLVGQADGLHRGACGDRTPAPLGTALQPGSVRFGSTGRLRAQRVDGEMVLADLDAGTVHPKGPGRPVGVDHWVDLRGRLRRGRRVVRRGLLEASCARWGETLAGPAGVVWSLTTGRPLFRRPRVKLGATVGTPRGFVTVDWESHEGATIDPASGQLRHRFRLPLDPDDTVVAGLYDDGAVHLTSALGERMRVVDGVVEPSSVLAQRTPTVDVATPAGTLTCAGAATVGAHHLAWTEDGWLFATPVP